MCGPALGLLGGIVSGIGSMASAEGQAASSEYNAKVEKINARSQRQAGVREQEGIEQKYQKVEGTAIANASKSGVDANYGSAALVIFGEGGANRAADTGTAYVNAEGKATAHDNKAKQYEMDAKNQRTAGMIGAASSFLNGIGGAAKGGGLKIDG